MKQQELEIPADIEKLLTRMGWLAYQASSVHGMGILQARDDVTEETFLGSPENRLAQRAGMRSPIFSEVHYKTRKPLFCLSLDYVFGRMMKLNVRLDANTLALENGDRAADPEYNSWAGTYKNTQELYDAAVASLQAEA